jgi:hypothetical protein
VNLRIAEAERARDLWKTAVLRARSWGRITRLLAVVFLGCGGVEVVVLHRPAVATCIALVLTFLAYVVHVLFANRADRLHGEVLSAVRVLDYGNDDSYAASRRILQSIAEFERR